MPLFVFGNILSLFAVSGYNITVKINGKQYDSVAIQGFSYEKQYTPVHTLPFASEMVFKGEKFLSPGFYLLTGNKETLIYFIISDDKTQNFKIIIDDGEVSFVGSKENTANQVYMANIVRIEQEITQLEQEAKRRRQQATLSNIETQTFIDSLMQALDAISTQRYNIQQKVIKEFKGYLIASLIKASIEMKNPPREYFSDKNKMENYYITHFFEYFPWEDFRILQTPVAYNRFLQFVRLLNMISEESAKTFITKLFTDLQPYHESYHFVFDFLEKAIGIQVSNSFMEQPYIAMLKNAVAYPKLEEAKKLRCETKLKKLNKNHPGVKAPDFNILLSTGDTTTFYDILADYTLLILQNPDCPTCKELREKLEKIESLNKAIAAQKVKVLTVYFEKDEILWRNYLKNANSNYIHGWNYDLSIENNELYDTYIIPFMFLLDKDKKILEKDIFWIEIESRFIEIGIK